MPENVTELVTDLIDLHREGVDFANLFHETSELSKSGKDDQAILEHIDYELIYLGDKHEDIISPKEKAKKYYDDWGLKCLDLLCNIVPQRFIFKFMNSKAQIQNDTDYYEIIASCFDAETKTLAEIIPEIEREYEGGHKQLFYDDDKDIKVSYDPKTRTIHVGNKVVRFREDAPFTPALCEIMFKDPTKLYELRDFQTIWDDLYDYIGNERPSDWHRVYEVLKRLNERIRNIAGIDDLFELNTKSVRINPKYLK